MTLTAGRKTITRCRLASPTSRICGMRGRAAMNARILLAKMRGYSAFAVLRHSPTSQPHSPSCPSSLPLSRLTASAAPAANPVEREEVGVVPENDAAGAIATNLKAVRQTRVRDRRQQDQQRLNRHSRQQQQPTSSPVTSETLQSASTRSCSALLDRVCDVSKIWLISLRNKHDISNIIGPVAPKQRRMKLGNTVL